MNSQIAVYGVSILLFLSGTTIKEEVHRQEIEQVRIDVSKLKPCDSVKYYNLGYSAGVASVEPVILHDTTKVPEKFNFHYRDSQAFIYTRNDSVFYKFYTRADSVVAAGKFKKNKIGVKK